MAQCYPAPDTWTDLRVELTDGERLLAETLIDELDDTWRLYLQPHVGGTRPDLVLVHPRAGVQLIEVKDYDLSAYELSGSAWQVKARDGRHAIRDPFEQVDAAREALFGTLLPFAGEARAQNRRLFGFTRAGVFLTRASDRDLKDVRKYLSRTRGASARHYGLGNRRALSSVAPLQQLIPILRYAQTGSRHVRAIEAHADAIGLARPWHEVLHGWLHPTPDEAAQNAPLTLTPAQEKAAWNTARRLLVTGPAGSGKTLVLARRAAHALVRDKDVLVLGFNITLWHYVRDLVARAVRTALLRGYQYTKSERQKLGRPALRRRVRRELSTRYTRAMRRLTITHYHRLAYDLWRSVGGEAQEVCPDTIAQRLVGAADRLRRRAADPESGIPTADVLLVDEGQDWGPCWLESLKPLLRKGAQVTVAADADQRIYSHASASAEALFDAAPRRAELDGTARVPAALLPALNAVAARWPDAGRPAPVLAEAEQLQLDFSGRPEPEAVWTTAERERLLPTAVAAVRRRILQGVNPSQIAVLVPTHEMGRALEPLLEKAGVPICSVCVDHPDSDRSRKHACWHLDARLKLSTVHSFKGWEADVVVALVPALPPPPEARRALHVALTRTRAVIEVIAPPGGKDLPRWTHRRGRSLLPLFPPALTRPRTARRNAPRQPPAAHRIAS